MKDAALNDLTAYSGALSAHVAVTGFFFNTDAEAYVSDTVGVLGNLVATVFVSEEEVRFTPPVGATGTTKYITVACGPRFSAQAKYTYP